MLFLQVTLSCYKNSCPTGCQGRGAGGGKSAFGQMSAPPPPPQLPASEMKQTFFSTKLACLLACEQQPARPHTPLGNSQGTRSCKPELKMLGAAMKAFKAPL